MLINRTNRSIARISQRPWTQNSMRRNVHIQSSSIDINEISSHSFRLLLILFLIFIPSSQHEHIMLLGLGLLAIPIDDPGHLLNQNPIVDIGLLGMEVFIKRSSDHTVRVDLNSEFLSHLSYIWVIPDFYFYMYFRSPPSWVKIIRFPPVSTSFFKF